ncbi:MAG: hypothetical protein ACR2PM_19230 [Hyphomicrobiales bacterium]
MAEIVELKTSQYRRAARRRPAGPAHVVIFPGVRIERQKFSLADRLDKPRQASARSRVRGRISERDK